MDRRRDRAKSDLDEVSAATLAGARPGGLGPMLTDPFTAVPAPKGPAAQPRGSAVEPGMSPVWPKPPAAQPAAGQPGPGPGGPPGPGGRRSQRSQSGGPHGPGGPGGPGNGSPPPRPPGKSRKRTILKWASVVTTIVLVAASLAAYVAYRDVVDGIKQEDVSNLLGKSRPPQYTSALNILVIGSDSRVGTDGQFGSTQAIQGARSDTMMLLHILPNHKGAVVISFPRDSLVPVIGCSADGQGDKGQTAAAGQNEMLNATYAAGGAACLWKTLESTTGIYINHFVEINFSGFTSVVNDLGGVNVCLPEAINDPASGLNLTAGEHHVSGAQALAFVRERHVGLGSDLQRIQRQQFFMAALLQQIDSEQVLANVPKVFAIARDVAKTLTTDSGLSVDDMRNIATSMKGLSTKGVQFTQVPVVQDPTDANRVLWEQPQSSQLFGEIAHDQTVPAKAKATATPTASGLAVRFRSGREPGERPGQRAQRDQHRGSGRESRVVTDPEPLHRGRHRQRGRAVVDHDHPVQLGHRSRGGQGPGRGGAERAGPAGQREQRRGQRRGRPDPRVRLHRPQGRDGFGVAVPHRVVEFVQHQQRHQDLRRHQRQHQHLQRQGRLLRPRPAQRVLPLTHPGGSPGRGR